MRLSSCNTDKFQFVGMMIRARVGDQSSALKICVAESKEKGFSKDYEKAMENPIKSEKIRQTCGQLKTADFVKNI